MTILTSASCTVSADWARVNPKIISIWPTGTVALFVDSEAGLANGCGTSNAFLIWAPFYGVTENGVNAMLATLMFAKASGQGIDIHYFPLDSCKVDSLSYSSG
jgi:hypothetical protein